MLKRNAFTIVELLVVIIVIAIIATLAIVSYSGITSKASAASLQADLSASSKKLKLYHSQYGSYPTSLDANNCPSAPTATSEPSYCLKISPSNTLSSYIANSSTFILKVVNNSNTLAYQVTESTPPVQVSVIPAGPTINSLYSGYDFLFCRYASDCSGVSGISSDFSYQVAFEAKSGTKYVVNMVKIDNTSNSWSTGTNLSANIAYSSPTSGVSITGNILTVTNAGTTRVTITGTEPRDKTVFVKIAESDASGNAISSYSNTKALGVYSSVGSHTLNSPAAGTVSYLIIAGGGGGGHHHGGGGGAGGYLTGSYSTIQTNYTFIVGGGGSGTGGNSTPNVAAGNGGNSSAFGLSSIGGGGGGGYTAGGASGGSGGGGSNWEGRAGGAGTSGQGYAGASGGGASDQGGAGGGASGTTAPPSFTGGPGLSSSITGSSVGRSGGGGAGGYYIAGGTASSGGGGGGTGPHGAGTNGSSGAANTGGGGGGTGSYTNSGGSGGSGIIIIRSN